MNATESFTFQDIAATPANFALRGGAAYLKFSAACAWPEATLPRESRFQEILTIEW